MKSTTTRNLLLGLAAVGAFVGGAIVIPPSQALADYSPPALVDAQTFPVRSAVTRLGLGRFGCHSVCRSARAGGVKPELCFLTHAMDAGTYVAAGLECAVESNAECTPLAVGECANPVQQ